MLMAGLLALSGGALVTSCCDDDDDYDTNQFKGGVSLTAASLQVTRGAYMTFKGSGLNQITSVEFPGGVSSTPEVVDQYTIRCLVPEGAEVGTVKLVYNGGELETKAIAFTEPITFEAFTPQAVTAGDVLTISGTYLNYIDFVKFATGENVPVENENRTEFAVKVPVDASTGKFSLGYYSVDGRDTVETLLESEAALTVAGPTGVKLSNSTVKAGQPVKIEGTLLRLVSTVTFEGVEPVSVAQQDPTKDIASLSVVLPAEAKSGEVILTLLSGLEVSAGELTAQLPTAALADAAKLYAVGDTVVIGGSNLDLVVDAAFTTDVADTLNLVASADGAVLKLAVSKAAKSGDITLKLANGDEITVEGFKTLKPVFTFPTSATPLDKLTVESTLAERVAKVFFGELEAEATSKGSSFTVQVPLLAENGCAVKFYMDNGEEVTPAVEAFAVNSFTFCAFKDPAAFTAQTPTIGTLASGVVVNGGNLDKVLLNGKETKYLVTGETLYVYVGTSMGEQTVTLVSGETNVDYTVKVIASGVVETALWTGPLEITWNDGGRVIVRWSDLESVPKGSTLRLYFNGKVNESGAVWAQAQLNNGGWNNSLLGTFVPSDVNDYNWWDGGAAEEHHYDIKLTADVLDHLHTNVGSCEDVSDAALIIQGEALIFSKVSVIIDYSDPKPIWSGSFDVSGWAGNMDLAYGAYDWSLVEAGQTLYFTVAKVNKGAWGCISLRHGDSWGALVDAPKQYDVAEDVDATTIEFTLTQGAIDDLVANGGLVITGDNLVLSKVAIK